MAKLYTLEAAREVAAEVVAWLFPACARLEVVGSIRREESRVHDVDILAFPKLVETEQRDLFGQTERVRALEELLPRLSFQERLHLQAGGDKYKKLIHARTGMPVDLYLVDDLTAWWTLMVIRTGSAEFNKRLCAHALKMGRRLHADGRGVERSGRAVKIGSELGIFQALKHPWIPPKERH